MRYIRKSGWAVFVLLATICAVGTMPAQAIHKAQKATTSTDVSIQKVESLGDSTSATLGIQDATAIQEEVITSMVVEQKAEVRVESPKIQVEDVAITKGGSGELAMSLDTGQADQQCSDTGQTDLHGQGAKLVQDHVKLKATEIAEADISSGSTTSALGITLADNVDKINSSGVLAQNQQVADKTFGHSKRGSDIAADDLRATLVPLGATIKLLAGSSGADIAQVQTALAPTTYRAHRLFAARTLGSGLASAFRQAAVYRGYHYVGLKAFAQVRAPSLSF